MRESALCVPWPNIVRISEKVLQNVVAHVEDCHCHVVESYFLCWFAGAAWGRRHCSPNPLLFIPLDSPFSKWYELTS